MMGECEAFWVLKFSKWKHFTGWCFLERNVLPMVFVRRGDEVVLLQVVLQPGQQSGLPGTRRQRSLLLQQRLQRDQLGLPSATCRRPAAAPAACLQVLFQIDPCVVTLTPFLLLQITVQQTEGLGPACVDRTCWTKAVIRCAFQWMLWNSDFWKQIISQLTAGRVAVISPVSLGSVVQQSLLCRRCFCG